MNVQLLIERDDISRAVYDLAPTKVAVAYVGADWKGLIPAARLEEIVVSPTVGTNPKAIRSLVTRLGWGRVHFLDQLHAKVYIGRRAVIVGSANLSANALGDGGSDLFEAVMRSSLAEHRRAALDAFEGYRDTAQADYPTPARKMERLKQLEAETERARRAGLFGSHSREPRTIANYAIGEHRIFVEWWTADGNTPDLGEPEDRNWINLRLGREKIRRGDWVLTWRCKNNGLPVANGGVEWLRINTIRRGRGGVEHYPDQVAETTRPPRGCQPFVLDARFKGLFRQVISGFNFDAMRTDAEDTPMRTPPAELVNALLADIQKRYGKLLGSEA